MRTFWHLPRSVRDTIYRLHLLQNEPITNERHREYVKRAHSISGPAMPPICHLSKQVEEEAAPIYYGENHFDIGAIARAYSSLTILTLTRRRHADLMTKITCEWCEWCSTENGQHSPPRSYLNFKELTRLKSLKELDIRVDETKKIKSLRNSLKTRQQSFDEDLTPQQQLSILRLPRILGILHLKPIEHVNFITLVDKNGRECGGPVRGGPLESIIPPRLRASKVDQDQGRQRGLPFLSLPAELRNRVYKHLLRIRGPVHPSTKPPTSAPKKQGIVKLNESRYHESVLSLLLVNKQIHHEAIGIFYNANEFVFYYPTQLHAFLLSIGSTRQKFVRAITLHYYNSKSGGVDITEFTTFPLLKHLTGLRKLHILMVDKTWHLPSTTTQHPGSRHPRVWPFSDREPRILRLNPGLIPGFKYLFDLRGITDIIMRDIGLERLVERLEGMSAYPEFPLDNDYKCVLQLSRAYAHFNAALVDAQAGRIKTELLQDNEWLIREEFPKIAGQDEDEKKDNNSDDGERACR